MENVGFGGGRVRYEARVPIKERAANKNERATMTDEANTERETVEGVKRVAQKVATDAKVFELTLEANSRDVERKVGRVLAKKARAVVGSEDAKIVAQVGYENAIHRYV